MPATLILVVIVALFLMSAVKVMAEYERAVVFRLGRLLPQAKGPGLVLIFPVIDRVVRISLQVDTLDVPPQDIITRDNVTCTVTAVVYYRVIDPQKAVVEVKNFRFASSQFAQTTLRAVLGEVEFDDLLSSREKLNSRLQGILDERTEPWGVKVTDVVIKAVDLPETMQRAIARQAEAEREKRAKIIHADGEYEAATRLSEAAAIIAREPIALQLRYLQTLVEIGTEKNTTVVFPLPMDLIEVFMTRGGGKPKPSAPGPQAL
ncbi:MAG TPA: SPFH domain-containing protein [Terriglobales bacterium]|nr:SPFH domain-containing protein [Terriglobales bacterium]